MTHWQATSAAAQVTARSSRRWAGWRVSRSSPRSLIDPFSPTLPFAIILVHAALQGIPRELYEQAAIDGANAWHRFRQITLPMLQQIITVILILRTAFAFAVFEEILAITQGGPGDATWVAAWYSYKISFSPPNNFGMGSASAFILALMIAAIALVYVRLIYRRVTL